MSINKKHLGGRNEMVACVWLMNNGYEVFRNVSQHGECDIIGKKDGTLTMFDVKGRQFDVKIPLSQDQAKNGIKAIIVYPDFTCEIIDPVANPERIATGLSEKSCKLCGTLIKLARHNQTICRGNECMKAYRRDFYERKRDGIKETPNS